MKFTGNAHAAFHTPDEPVVGNWVTPKVFSEREGQGVDIKGKDCRFAGKPDQTVTIAAIVLSQHGSRHSKHARTAPSTVHHQTVLMTEKRLRHSLRRKDRSRLLRSSFLGFGSSSEYSCRAGWCAPHVEEPASTISDPHPRSNVLAFSRPTSRRLQLPHERIAFSASIRCRFDVARCGLPDRLPTPSAIYRRRVRKGRAGPRRPAGIFRRPRCQSSVLAGRTRAGTPAGSEESDPSFCQAVS